MFHKTAKQVLVEVAPRAGRLLLHAHGRRCLMHEGAEVTRGAKYLLRADIMYRPREAADEAAVGSSGQGVAVAAAVGSMGGNES